MIIMARLAEFEQWAKIRHSFKQVVTAPVGPRCEAICWQSLERARIQPVDGVRGWNRGGPESSALCRELLLRKLWIIEGPPGGLSQACAFFGLPDAAGWSRLAAKNAAERVQRLPSCWGATVSSWEYQPGKTSGRSSSAMLCDCDDSKPGLVTVMAHLHQPQSKCGVRRWSFSTEYSCGR